jgi:hypothetical protein
LLQAAPVNFQPSLVRMLSLRKCLKLTLASGATALGSAWPAPLVYQTEPLPVILEQINITKIALQGFLIRLYQR